MEPCSNSLGLHSGDDLSNDHHPIATPSTPRASPLLEQAFIVCSPIRGDVANMLYLEKCAKYAYKLMVRIVVRSPEWQKS